jgi:hypothetical protein
MNVISAQRFHDFTVDRAKERAVLTFAESGGSLAALEVAYAEMNHVITHLIHYYANARQKADTGHLERHGTWAEFPCWAPQSVHLLDSFPKVIVVFDMNTPSQLAYGFSANDARNLAMMLSKAADDVDAKLGAPKN